MRTLSPALHNLSLCPILSVPPSSREAEPLVRNLRGSSPWNEKWQWLSDNKTRKTGKRRQKPARISSSSVELDSRPLHARRGAPPICHRGTRCRRGKVEKVQVLEGWAGSCRQNRRFVTLQRGIYPLPGQSSPFSFQSGKEQNCVSYRVRGIRSRAIDEQYPNPTVCNLEYVHVVIHQKLNWGRQSSRRLLKLG